MPYWAFASKWKKKKKLLTFWAWAACGQACQYMYVAYTNRKHHYPSIEIRNLNHHWSGFPKSNLHIFLCIWQLKNGAWNVQWELILFQLCTAVVFCVVMDTSSASWLPDWWLKKKYSKCMSCAAFSFTVYFIISQVHLSVYKFHLLCGSDLNFTKIFLNLFTLIDILSNQISRVPGMASAN